MDQKRHVNRGRRCHEDGSRHIGGGMASTPPFVCRQMGLHRNAPPPSCPAPITCNGVAQNPRVTCKPGGAEGKQSPSHITCEHGPALSHIHVGQHTWGTQKVGCVGVLYAGSVQGHAHTPPLHHVTISPHGHAQQDGNRWGMHDLVDVHCQDLVGSQDVRHALKGFCGFKVMVQCFTWDGMRLVKPN
jgi:hypothetical protein